MNDDLYIPPLPDSSRSELRVRLSELRQRLARPTAEVVDRFTVLEQAFESIAAPVRARLLATPLAWTPGEHQDAAWIRRTTDEIATVAYRLWEAFARHAGNDDPRSRDMMARTLLRMGDTVKWEAVVAPDAPRDFRKHHAMMRCAMAAGRHRETLEVRRDGHSAECTVESLYFRVLLLARLSGSGVLSCKQVEILDAWLWLWMPALRCTEEAPTGDALRADLDSGEGLRRGPRGDSGPCLYLPSAPIEHAYRAIVSEFHAGRMVPSQGITAQFRIEEHVAVLNLIRDGLRASARSPLHRAERRKSNLVVELLVGLTEIMDRGFTQGTIVAGPALSLATSGGQRVDGARERTDGYVGVYDRHTRMVRVANVSESGFGVEGDAEDCGGISVSDLVALRLDPAGPLELCKVVRCVPAIAPNRIFIGIRRLSSNARPVDLFQPTARSEREREVTLLFVPGDDSSGRHDACLVSERAYAQRLPIDAYVGDHVYTFRFNRARDSGRGWVLGGFEITAAQEAAMARR